MKKVEVAAISLALATVCPTLTDAAVTKSRAFDSDILKTQVMLDRLGFGPGAIDGQSGANMVKAIKGLQEARGLHVTGQLDDPTKQALAADDDTPGTIEISITPADAAGPFAGAIPKDPADQAKLPSMGYSDLMEELSERYHTTRQTLIALNSADTPLTAGTKIKVPNVRPSATDYAENLRSDWKATLTQLSVSSDQPKAARIVVDKSDGVLRVYDDQDKLVAQFPATMGSTHDPLPIGNWKILGTSYLPRFHYNPNLFWDAKATDTKETLQSGPNGPVGVVWMELDKAHYGIHGTATPETIGRTTSHGCIRLTNWDAARLSLMVKPGTPAIFQK